MIREIVGAVVAALIVLVLARLGVAERLGAHPFWSVKIGYYGVGAGLSLLIVSMLFKLRAGTRLLVGLLCLGLAFVSAKVGAARFAASYAEDAIAGKMWFFGWIGVAAGLFLAIAALMAARRR